jgi:hypothetical protein
MELNLYQHYTRDELLAQFGGVDRAEAFCNAEFIVFPQATVCLFTTRIGLSPSHFTNPSSFTWRPRGQPDVDDCYVSGLPPAVTARHHHLLFVRTSATQAYLYVGAAHLGSYVSAGKNFSADYYLDAKLPRSAWLAVGGALTPPDPFAHLRTLSGSAVSLTYHQPVFDLLHLTPQVSERALQRLHELEDRHSLSLPAAVQEWYSLVGAMDILHSVSLMHEPADIPNELLDPTAEQFTYQLLQTYQTTPPYLRMLPLMFENQWCWHIAFPTSTNDNPKVYQGERLDPSGQYYQFDWRLHTESFSDFVWAWVWDYVTYARDYQITLPIYSASGSELPVCQNGCNN